MIEAFQRTNLAKAPRRKFRGKRRYFRRVLSHAREFRLEVDGDAWWDYWHYHADWPGWGNRCWKYRKFHLEALSVVFQHCAQAFRQYPNPFQLWIFICGGDAGHDGVFVHTPNPNRDDFPYMPQGVTWGHPDIESVFCPVPVRAGTYAYEGNTDCCVYAPGLGVPLDEREERRTIVV
jgi:hypothetical protein